MAITASFYATLPAGAEWTAHATNGSVICVLEGNSSRCMRSTDGGMTWTARTLPFSGYWTAIVWGNGKFCALSNESTKCATSPDGITWTQRNLPMQVLWSALTWDGSVFCAVAGYSTDCATSPDGITWTAHTIAIHEDWIAVCNNSTHLVAVNAYSANAAYSSNHGVSWTTVTLPNASNLWSLVAVGEKFIAVGDAGVYVSTTNGDSWTTLTGPSLPVAMSIAVAQADSTRLIAFSGTGILVQSTDAGATWQAAAAAFSTAFIGLSSIGNNFYAVEQNGKRYVKLAPDGAPELPPESTGAASVPLVVSVVDSGQSAIGLDVAIVPAAILSGGQSVCIGAGVAARWTIVVRINDIDVSEMIDGDVRVDAEESAARIAELAIRPEPGTVLSLTEWTGRTVIIDVADASTGTPRYPMRLFTGVVDTPSLDHGAGLVSLRCTDDLQGRCEAMSNDALHLLIGGYDAPAVFDPAARGWNYAQDRLSTVTASLDISPSGAVRLTPWAAKSIADITLDENLIGERSLNPSIANRASLVNAVDVQFDYRFPRLKAETYVVGHSYVGLSNFANFLLGNNWFLQRRQVTAAIEAAGGHVESVTYEALPTWIIAVGSGFFTPSAADLELCMGFTAAVSFDYAQTIEEQHRIRVQNARSIALIGLRQTELSGALEGAYPDLSATETSIKLYKEKTSSIPPTDIATGLLEKTTSVNATLTTETNRDAADAAMRALIAIAKTRIFASHRSNSLSATVPLMPAIDVDKTIAVSADGIAAKGKCSRVSHRLSPSAGLAVSDFTLAICSIAGVGITHDDAPIIAPAGTTTAATTLSDPATVVFNAGPSEDHVLTITFPGVAEAERANAIRPLPSTIAAGLVEDVFTVTM